MKPLAYPKIESARPLRQKRLLVQFRNGETRIFDCRPLLEKPPFTQLHDESIFKSVKVDAGGYGISWTDDMDVSESELWIRGKKPNQRLHFIGAKRAEK